MATFFMTALRRVISLIFVCMSALAQVQFSRATEPAPPYDAGEVRYLDSFSGSQRAREMLLRQGFVVTGQQFRQIFEAYVSAELEPRIPNFITEDSAWHTYHVLLEDGIRQLEQRATETKGLRPLGPRRFPSAELLQRTVAPQIPNRPFPSGIDVFAAGPLACDAGRLALKQAVPNAATAAAIEKTHGGPLPDSLHGDAMRLLTLLQAPPAKAPAFFHTPAWQDKQLATGLAAWAEEQHPSALQTKITGDYADWSSQSPGHVSPYPQFFRQLAQLSRRAAKVLAEATGAPDLVATGRESLISGEKSTTAFARAPEGEAVELLPKLATLCDRLAEIAQKQLERKPLDRADVELIRGYGATLGRLHFYGATAYVSPRDDLPIVAPVFVSTEDKPGAKLYVGVARPEAIYVILHDGKRPVLHRGAVLSYRELRRPIDEPLDDAQWIEQIRAGKAPPPPAFTHSFRDVIPPAELAAQLRAGTIYPGLQDFKGREIKQALLDVLASGKLEYPEWFARQLFGRVTVDDAPALIGLMEKASSNSLHALEYCFSKFDWTPHRVRLMELLDHPRDEVAQAAFRVLAESPERVDVAALMEGYARRPTRVRCLYLHLLGKSKRPGPAGERLLLAALTDKEPNIRSSGAWAAVYGGVRSPEVVAALTAGLTDENGNVARAMVYALAALDIQDAAPRILDRLKEVLSPEHRLVMKQHAAIGKAAGRPEAIAPPVSELIRALGKLRHPNAKVMFRGLLCRSKSGVLGSQELETTLNVLLEMEPDGGKQRTLLLGILGDSESSQDSIALALHLIEQRGDIGYILPLIPLMEKPHLAPVPDEYTRCVAHALGSLASHLDRSKPDEARLCDQVRKRILVELGRPDPVKALEALYAFDKAAATKEALAVALGKQRRGQVRSRALNLLAEHPEPSCIRQVLPLLDDRSRIFDDPNGPMRSETIGDCAAGAIGKICGSLSEGHAARDKEGVEWARAALTKLLPGPSGAEAVEALASLHGEDRDTFLVATARDRTLPDATRSKAWEALGGCGRSSAVKLLPLLGDVTVKEEGEITIAEEALQTIVELLHSPSDADKEQDAEMVDQLRPALEQAIRGPHGERAMDALAALNSRQGNEALLRAAGDGSLPLVVRGKAIELIGIWGGPRFSVKLIPLLEDQAKLPPEGEREDNWFTKKIDDWAAAAIKHSFENSEPDSPERFEAAQLLRGPLEKMLRGQRGEVVVEALAALDKKNRPEVLIQIASDRSLLFRPRRKAIQVLGNLHQPKLAAKLDPLLDDMIADPKGSLSIGEEAANAISLLLDKKEKVSLAYTEAARAEFVRKARAWGKEK
ncbi:MAG: DUF3160 domain-containing protein [Planctomycetes bacterium]|nr:DUF3160 domain-containing protein [Planctomycetota bacterium]